MQNLNTPHFKSIIVFLVYPSFPTIFFHSTPTIANFRGSIHPFCPPGPLHANNSFQRCYRRPRHGWTSYALTWCAKELCHFFFSFPGWKIDFDCPPKRGIFPLSSKDSHKTNYNSKISNELLILENSMAMRVNSTSKTSKLT